MRREGRSLYLLTCRGYGPSGSGGGSRPQVCRDWWRRPPLWPAETPTPNVPQAFLTHPQRRQSLHHWRFNTDPHRRTSPIEEEKMYVKKKTNNNSKSNQAHEHTHTHPPTRGNRALSPPPSLLRAWATTVVTGALWVNKARPSLALWFFSQYITHVILIFLIIYLYGHIDCQFMCLPPNCLGNL